MASGPVRPRERSRASRLASAFRDAPTAVIATALWSLRALIRVRRALRDRRLDPDELPQPPRAPDDAEVVMNAILRASRSTCLTRSVVRQQWFAARGDRRDLLIGVTSSSPRFRAHAWIEGDPEWNAAGYTEILRRGPDELLVPPADESAFD